MKHEENFTPALIVEKCPREESKNSVVYNPQKAMYMSLNQSEYSMAIESENEGKGNNREMLQGKMNVYFLKIRIRSKFFTQTILEEILFTFSADSHSHSTVPIYIERLLYDAIRVSRSLPNQSNSICYLPYHLLLFALHNSNITLLL